MPLFQRRSHRSRGEKQLAEALADTIQRQVEREHRPLGQIGLAIVRASTTCRDEVKRLIRASTEQERQEREIYIFYEFIYFYMHMTMRYASGQLTESQVEKLHSFLGPLIVSTAIDSYFAHWPDDIKEKMRLEFYDNLNRTELDYTECSTFELGSTVPASERSTRRLMALWGKLRSNVAVQAGYEEKSPNMAFLQQQGLPSLDPDILATEMCIANTAVRELRRMRLHKLIPRLGKAIR